MATGTGGSDQACRTLTLETPVELAATDHIAVYAFVLFHVPAGFQPHVDLGPVTLNLAPGATDA
jgi:hypothetical protein